jgi:hypothetical protein
VFSVIVIELKFQLFEPTWKNEREQFLIELALLAGTGNV